MTDYGFVFIDAFFTGSFLRLVDFVICVCRCTGSFDSVGYSMVAVPYRKLSIYLFMKYTITACMLLLALYTQAQSKPNPLQWRFGVKTDLNFSNINGNGMANGYQLGAQFGAYAEKPLSSRWSIQPELLFTQSNTKKAADFTTFYNTEGNLFASDNIKLGYISVPVLMKYKINNYFSLLAGPQYSMMLFDAESLIDDNRGVAFKRYELSANAGLQFNIGSVALYGRYNLGLTNINDIDSRYAWRSRHLQLGVAFRIR